MVCYAAGAAQPCQFLSQLGGQFEVVFYGDVGPNWPPQLPSSLPMRTHCILPAHSPLPSAPPAQTLLHDDHGEWAKRYAAQPGSVYLFRPDQYLCARWRHYDPAALQNAIARACGAT